MISGRIGTPKSKTKGREDEGVIFPGSATAAGEVGRDDCLRSGSMVDQKGAYFAKQTPGFCIPAFS